jgi:hypothetical protein
MYYRHGDLVTEAFIAGLPVLYRTVKEYPELRMVPIDRVDAVRQGLKQLGYRVRIRYRGPHGPCGETYKVAAQAFTVYFQD